MDRADENQTTAALSSRATGAVGAMPAPATLVHEDKPDINMMSRAPNLKFPVPTFYDEDPELCFRQLKVTFTVNKVTTEKDKYAVVVSNLLFKVVRRIPRTIITKKEPYSVLKELVVKETYLCDYQHSKKLHTLPMLGDQRPSQLLTFICNLQSVADCKCYCARYQFLSRMPPIRRAQLVNQKDLSVNKLAALADMIKLSQASLHNLMAEVDANSHNDEVFAVNPFSQRASASKKPQ